MKQPTHSKAGSAKDNLIVEAATFIGIDYHKRYSVFHAVDAAGRDLGKGRVEHHSPKGFPQMLARWPHPRVVFEASMNWHWLFEVLEEVLPSDRITLANPEQCFCAAADPSYPSSTFNPPLHAMSKPQTSTSPNVQDLELDSPQRWTAKRKAALIIDILQGKTTAAEAARQHALTLARPPHTPSPLHV